jgi:cytochrome c oxidase subunit 2
MSAAPFAQAPLNYLTGAGPLADPVVALTWGLLIISVVVTVIVTGLVAAGVLLRRMKTGDAARVAVRPSGDGLRWLWIGMAVSTVTLAVSLVWTVAVLAQINTPAAASPLTIRVTGLQWWWRAVYQPDRPGERFETANEIHIPVGVPVRVELLGGDVIHSFWIPQLNGKTDTIPGRTNVMWLQADRPGRYAGQCTEYCGLQHAKMGLTVIAEPAAAFAAWRSGQRRAAPPAQGEGPAVFARRCAKCHAVRGTDAAGPDGPDLTHLMSRRTLAAGAAPNTLGGLEGWIANPQGVKPGALMPAAFLTGPQLQSVAAYLETLR